MTVKIILRWMKTNSVMLVNATSLVGTTAVTSILGFVYWWAAAKLFSPEVVGVASASISAMTLLGGFCIFGLGTLLITELPRQPERAGELISTALIVVGGVSACAGAGFAVTAPHVSPGFKPIGANFLAMIIFAAGVVLTATTLVLDQALVGLLRGTLQFWRNALFAVAKLAAVIGVGLLSGRGNGLSIYATWAIGNLLSLLALAAFVVARQRRPWSKYSPRWGLLCKLGGAALQHHLLNLVLQAPTLLLPVLVTVTLSPTMNAWFYVAWMIASFVFLVPNVLTIVLHAMNSAQHSTLARKARVTMGMGAATSLLANGLLQLTARQALSVFGGSYAVQASPVLRILVLAAFPLIVKYHYISICRIKDRIAQAMFGMFPGGLLELGAAVVGGHLGGLAWLCAGWVAAIYIESVFMFPTVYKTVFSPASFPLAAEPYAREAALLWLIETNPLPIVSQGHLAFEAPWLIDTSVVLPVLRLPSKGSAERGNQFIQPSQVNWPRKSQRPHLKPIQLQSYAPPTDLLPTTGPRFDGQLLQEIYDSGTMFEDRPI